MLLRHLWYLTAPTLRLGAGAETFIADNASYITAKSCHVSEHWSGMTGHPRHVDRLRSYLSRSLSRKLLTFELPVEGSCPSGTLCASYRCRWPTRSVRLKVVVQPSTLTPVVGLLSLICGPKGRPSRMEHPRDLTNLSLNIRLTMQQLHLRLRRRAGDGLEEGGPYLSLSSQWTGSSWWQDAGKDAAQGCASKQSIALR